MESEGKVDGHSDELIMQQQRQIEKEVCLCTIWLYILLHYY